MIQHLLNTHICSKTAEYWKGSGSLAYVCETDVVRTNKITIMRISCISIAQHIA